MHEKEMMILGLLERQRLAKKSELKGLLGAGDGDDDIIRSLAIADYIRAVEPIGEKCFVLTPEGTRRLRELRLAAAVAARSAQEASAARGMAPGHAI